MGREANAGVPLRRLAGFQRANNIATMLTAPADGKNEASEKLNVRVGIAFLAFVPIGELPLL